MVVQVNDVWMELRAESLRIGNFITTPYCEISQIDEVGLKDGNGYVKIKDKPMGYYLSSCKAIPLTEEILVNNFGIKYNGLMFSNCRVYEVGDIRIFYHRSNRTFSIGHKNMSPPSTVFIEIKFLHQFQNAMSILTGQELNLKL